MGRLKGKILPLLVALILFAAAAAGIHGQVSTAVSQAARAEDDVSLRERVTKVEGELSRIDPQKDLPARFTRLETKLDILLAILAFVGTALAVQAIAMIARAVKRVLDVVAVKDVKGEKDGDE